MGIAHKSLLIFSNRVVTALFPVIMAAILARMIDMATFGVYRQVTAIGLFFSSIFCLNLDQSLYYFMPRLPRAERRNFMLQTILQAAVFGFCAAGIMWLSAGKIASHFAQDASLEAPLKAYSLFVLFHIVAIQIPAALISMDRALAAGVFKITEGAVRCGVVLLAFSLGHTLAEVMRAAAFTMAAASVGGLVALFICTRGPVVGISLKSVREQALYIIPLAVAALAGILSMQIDKWVVMRFFSPEQYAAFSVGAIQIPMVMLVASSLMHAMMPRIVRLCAEGDRLAALALWHKGVRKAALVLFPVFVCMLFLSGDIIEILFGAQYIEAAGPFVVYLALIPLRVAVYSTILRAAGKTRPVFTAAIMSVLLNIVLSCSLVMVFRGTYMAFLSPALATVASIFVSALYQLVAVGKTAGVSFSGAFPWRRLGGLMACAVICAAAMIPSRVIFNQASWRVLGGTVAYALCYVALISKLRILEKPELQILIHCVANLRRSVAGRFGRHFARRLFLTRE